MIKITIFKDGFISSEPALIRGEEAIVVDMRSSQVEYYAGRVTDISDGNDTGAWQLTPHWFVEIVNEEAKIKYIFESKMIYIEHNADYATRLQQVLDDDIQKEYTRSKHEDRVKINLDVEELDLALAGAEDFIKQVKKLKSAREQEQE